MLFSLFAVLNLSAEDKPQSRKIELQNIIEKAVRNIDGHTLLEASEKYVKVVSSINWKESRKVREDMDSLLTDFAELHKDRSYPVNAHLDFKAIKYGESRAAELEAYIEKYSPSAMALKAEAAVLISQMNKLSSADGEKAYMDFRSRCLEFESRRLAFKGKEGNIAKSILDIENTIKRLDSKGIAFSVQADSLLQIRLRNLKYVRVNLKDGDKLLWRKDVQNADGRYYIYDTVKLALPKVSDGRYLLVCSSGDFEVDAEYFQHSVSLAHRRGPDGIAIYAADFQSGRPLEKADIYITDNKSGEVRSYQNFVFDGFTPLPQSISEFVSKGNKLLKLSYMDGEGFRRESDNVYIHNGIVEPDDVEKECQEGRIFLDRAAYNPGDTVQFKAVIYNMCFQTAGVIKEGTPMQMKLFDAQRKLIGEKELSANVFGSAASAFVLPKKTERNGSFSVAAFVGEKEMARQYFNVDDFVLPSFVIDFEENEDVYFPGDMVSVRGRVKSYSGHSLSGASLTYNISADKFNESGTLQLDGDGVFHFTFTAKEEDYAWYSIKVKVSSAAGESSEKSAYLLVSSLLSINMELDETPAAVEFFGERWRYNPYMGESVSVLKSEHPEVKIYVNNNYSDVLVPLALNYSLQNAGAEILKEGVIASGDCLSLDLETCKSGIYILRTEAGYTDYSGQERRISHTKKLVLIRDGDSVIDCPELDYMIKEYTPDQIRLQLASVKPLWGVAELYDDKGNVLKSEKIELAGAGRAAVLNLHYEYEDAFADRLMLRLLFFRDGRAVNHSVSCYRALKKYELPMEFTRFTDVSGPREKVSFRIRTAPDVEAMVSVYDKSLEAIASNEWTKIYRPSAPARFPYIYTNIGSASAYGSESLYDETTEGEAVPFSVSNTSAVFRMSKNADSVPVAEEVQVRDNFAKTLVFLPALYPDKDGYIDFEVLTADKLSTYYVQLFAHDKLLNTAVARGEMLVTMPVQLSFYQPTVLYEGDEYVLRASVSNLAESALTGTVMLYLYDTEEYKTAEALSCVSKEVILPAKGETSVEFELKVPGGIDILGYKLVFVPSSAGAEFADALFDSTPVKPAVQEITESHSAIARDGVKEELLMRFKNTAEGKLEYTEISLLEMMRRDLPEMLSEGADDVLSRSAIYYMSMMLSLDSSKQKEFLDKLLEYQNADGGFAWFEGFASSPVLTAVVLKRLAAVYAEVAPAFVERAVKYLDNQYFDELPSWRGGVSLQQYLYIRSHYSDVAFAPFCSADKLEQFRDAAASYLFDKASSELSILSKARRCYVLYMLSSEESSFAEAVLQKKSMRRKAGRMLEKNMEYLMEYALPHSSGGVYFPNAVMPLRGLLESEVYAHTLLCKLMQLYGSEASLKLADDLRLWLLLQKETQQWRLSPAYVDAVNAVMQGSEAVLNARVAVLSRTMSIPFEEIKESGNGFRLERKVFLRSDDGSLVEIVEGDSLALGDRIVVKYRIWSEENRSFVKLSAALSGTLRPVRQVSGNLYSPLRFHPGLRSSVYREVRSDVVNWYMEVCPEEHTEFSEEYYITATGNFVLPAVTVESSYSPHYRANTDVSHLAIR